MIQLLIRLALRVLPPVRVPVTPVTPRPAPTPLLDGEQLQLQLVSLPDSVILLGAGRNRGLYAELSIAQAVRLRCELDDALVDALKTGPSTRERHLLLGHEPPEPA